jgi:hypothetical protein
MGRDICRVAQSCSVVLKGCRCQLLAGGFVIDTGGMKHAETEGRNLESRTMPLL